MKIMYMASQPDDGAELNVGQEIGLLQSQLLGRNLPNLELTFNSDLTVEQFRTTVASFRPDIIHISAHSDQAVLRLRNTEKEVVCIDASKLNALIPSRAKPKLLILSSCNSTALIAKEAKENIPICISFSGRIKFSVASCVILQLYEHIVAGDHLGHAVASCQQRLAIEQPLDVSLDITASAKNWDQIVFYRPPVVVVRLVQKKVRTNRDGRPAANLLEIGLDGAPSDVVQVIFCTDDRGEALDSDFDPKDELDLESWRASKMARIVFGPPSMSGCLWSSSAAIQEADQRIYAVAVRTGSERSFVIESSIAEGLENAVHRGLCESSMADEFLRLAAGLRQAARSRSLFMDK